MPTTLGDKLRKNGKKPSCEPCRVRKQSCDHEQPCHRCQRHSRACFYAAAPMTKAKVPGTGASALPSPSSEGTPTPSSTFSVPAIPASLPKPAPTKRIIKRTNPLTLRSGGHIGYARLPTSLASIGHTGKTAFSAILQEAEEVPGELWGDESSTDVQPQEPWDDRGLEFCKEILAWLPKREVGERVLQGWADQALSHPAMFQMVHRSLWDTFGQLIEDGTPRKLKQVADVLVKNTKKPMPCLPRTNEEWLNGFLGKKLRWEIVGHVFIQLGDVAVTMQNNDAFFEDIIPPECEGSRRSYACSMLECADACLLLAEELDLESNVFTASLRGRCVCLQSVVQGDSGLELWKRAGAMCNTITGLGLHLELHTAEPVAAAFLEFRSSVFWRAYKLDKTIASFTGRPPALSRRYVTIPMILDLPESVVLQESSYAKLKSLVDVNGWAPHEDLQAISSTFHRAGSILALLRDEILEVSLGRASNDLPQRAAELREKHRLAYENLPEWVRREPSQEDFRSRGTGMGARATWALLRIALRNVVAHNCLLIERITIEGRDEAYMMTMAKFMLNNVLIVWNNRDFIKYQDDIQWSLSAFGIPAASALALDLLRQTRQNAMSFDRSETIQQLSVFLVALEWVKPEDGNYALCGRLGGMIKAILDRALSPATAATLSPSMPVFDMNLGDITLDGLGNDLGYFLESFENFDWSGPGMLQL